jgi:hypothetical protein
MLIWPLWILLALLLCGFAVLIFLMFNIFREERRDGKMP